MPLAVTTAHGADILVRGLSKHYAVPGGEGVNALVDVSLDIASGASVALMGPSGSGKSTLLHHLGAIDTPDTGSIRVGGVEVSRLRGRPLAEYRRRVGFVFQKFNLIPTLSVLDNVLAPVIPYRKLGDRTVRARELLEHVGLADRADSSPLRLSGGQQQRVAIARALIGEPDLLLADEPTGALDSHTGADILALLLSCRVTTVIATHDASVAGRCDRTIQLADGALVAG